MEGTYDIFMGIEVMGKATVGCQGLYYSFSCRCRKNTDQLLEVWLEAVGGLQKLGVMVPRNAELTLDTKLAVKKIGEGNWRFVLRPRHSPVTETFVPLSPQEPFAYLRRLEDAFLAVHNGRTGIVFKE